MTQETFSQFIRVQCRYIRFWHRFVEKSRLEFALEQGEHFRELYSRKHLQEGATNVNPQTNVRYGVIYLNHLDPGVADRIIDAVYEENPGIGTSEEDGSELIEELPCGEATVDKVRILLGELGGQSLLWVLHSPHITRARLCSPFVPNAGDLDSITPDSMYECYNVPDSWREK